MASAKGDDTDKRLPERGIVEWSLGQLFDFVEYWAWFIGFILVASWGFLFGYRKLDNANQIENQTREVLELRGAIQAGDDTAGPRLDALIDQIAKQRKSKEQRAAEAKWPERYGRHWLIGVGGFLLLSLAVLPNTSLGPLSLADAKESAWRVLDSSFATAFAAVWIAILAFAASQSQREQEAQRNYAFASADAQQVRNAQASAYEKYQFSRYNEVYDTVLGIEFTPDEVGTPLDEDDVAGFRTVTTHALRLALADRISVPSNLSEIERQIELLEHLTKKPLFQRLGFTKFLERLLEARGGSAESADWSGLLHVLRYGNSSEKWNKIREVAKDLREPT